MMCIFSPIKAQLSLSVIVSCFVINKTLYAVTTTVRDRMPEQCRKWVSHGDCYLHQEFMLQNCRESCMAGGYVDGEYKGTLRCSLTNTLAFNGKRSARTSIITIYLEPGAG